MRPNPSNCKKRYIRKELTQRQKCRKSDIDGISEKQSDVCEEISSTEEKTDASDDESDNDSLACDRYGVSDRAAAGIASAVLQDIGIIHERDVSKVIDRSKVRRERCKKRGTLCASVSNTITGLYFDGRKDSTMTLIKECDGKFHRKLITEEHISIISEPGSIYFGHITPTAGSSKVIAAELIAYLSKKNVDLGGIKAVGCDGTVANTGNRGGIIRLLEVALDKPLQWFVCQLHANELPLRHLFEHLDGPTNGPKGFSGPIGKSLVDCEKLPVVKYTPINCVLPSGLNSDDLSTDQKYLFDLNTAVSVRVCPVGLSLRNPDGARHVHNTILKSRYLTDELKKVVDPVIQRNAFFTHPENLLLAMLTDEKSEIRELALRRIMKSRKQKRTSSVRSFCVPLINFEATSYIDMIDWQKTPITEPAIVMDIDDDTFLTMIREEDTLRLDFARYPCHTQSKLYKKKSSLTVVTQYTTSDNMKLLYVLLSCVLLLAVSLTSAAPAPVRRDVRAPKRAEVPYKRAALLPDGRSLIELEGFDWDERAAYPYKRLDGRSLRDDEDVAVLK
ncbi:hypothetical protein Bpfe_003567 [Biomphalaria pfeifferi]|uniref:Uncharacterized protein n=1 Tax=Biomphalaria pfeifferi TaxID=112525 RepID=A0AAD8C6H3_BIOPF|nr:hypothetical protein Bpfe_003567 [Biomphalaria pfeifferi]